MKGNDAIVPSARSAAFGTFGLEGIPRKCYGIGSNFSAFCRPELAE